VKPEYPYPTLDEHGYEFDLIEQESRHSYEFDLPDFPNDDERFSAGVGDLVKLIFRYRDWIEENGHTVTCERMWVRITSDIGTCLCGALDNDPRYTKLLHDGDTVSFHPKHIVQIWHPTS
jgi:hypothetical protein